MTMYGRQGKDTFTGNNIQSSMWKKKRVLNVQIDSAEGSSVASQMSKIWFWK